MNGGFSQEEDQSIKIIWGGVNQEFVDCLRRSIVHTTHERRDFQALASTLISDFGQCAENVLKNHGELDQWFIESMKQEGFDIFGVPLHGWTKENFKNIAKLRVDLFAWSIYRRTEFFESIKVLIDTDILRRIKVIEVRSSVQVIQKVHTPARAPPMEDRD
ncbi:hypothetical protein Cgig2_001977 [Carnegiea gigantea]|uniref:Uncharacterized protein n=1 Tax=Carnegiea gigantea TaxID=171969 RepID=A0A9Q1QAM2_9CARY|nr:hypothetical protein Cgig2_001977 [Carnegiea gigantea]